LPSAEATSGIASKPANGGCSETEFFYPVCAPAVVDRASDQFFSLGHLRASNYFKSDSPSVDDVSLFR
jgi:hypothetical protein